MAVETRLTYDLILTEHLKRSRQETDTGYEARAKQFIVQAVFDLARLVKHRDLDSISTAITFTATDLSYTLPTDCQEVVALKIVDPDEATDYKILVPSGFSSVFQSQQQKRTGLPQAMAVWARKLHFDRLAEKLYTTTLYYYSDPTAPDFQTASPVTPPFDRVWDAHILEYSLALSGLASGSQEVSQSALQSLQPFLSGMPDQKLVELELSGPQHNETDRAGGMR